MMGYNSDAGGVLPRRIKEGHMLATKMLMLTDAELEVVRLQAASEFKATPTTKKEAVAKKVWLAATAEQVLRTLRPSFAARAAA